MERLLPPENPEVPLDDPAEERLELPAERPPEDRPPRWAMARSSRIRQEVRVRKISRASLRGVMVEFLKLGLSGAVGDDLSANGMPAVVLGRKK